MYRSFPLKTALSSLALTAALLLPERAPAQPRPYPPMPYFDVKLHPYADEGLFVDPSSGLP